MGVCAVFFMRLRHSCRDALHGAMLFPSNICVERVCKRLGRGKSRTIVMLVRLVLQPYYKMYLLHSPQNKRYQLNNTRKTRTIAASNRRAGSLHLKYWQDGCGIEISAHARLACMLSCQLCWDVADVSLLELLEAAIRGGYCSARSAS